MERTQAFQAGVLSAIQQSSPDGILLVDPQGRIVSRNQRFLDMWAVPPDVAASKIDGPLLEFVASQVADPASFVARVDEIYATIGETSHEEVNLKDGRVFDRNSRPVRLDDGTVLGRVWFFRDITERRNVEESLRASEERFRMLVEEAPDAILLYDYDQDRFIAANKAAERLFGVARDQILEHGPRHFYAPRQPDARPVAESYSDHNKRALAGEEITYERRIRQASGEERLCQVTLVRLPSKVRCCGRVSSISQSATSPRPPLRRSTGRSGPSVETLGLGIAAGLVG